MQDVVQDDHSDTQVNLDPAQTPETPQIPENKTLAKILILISAVLLLLSAALAYFWFREKNTTPTPVPTQFSKSTPTPTPVPAVTTIESKDVEWLSEPQKVSPVGALAIFDKTYPYYIQICKSDTDCNTETKVYDKYEPKTVYYKVGTMKTNYQGSDVYMAITKNLVDTHVYKGLGTEKDIVYDTNIATLFIKNSDNTYVFTNDYENKMLFCLLGGCQGQTTPQINNSQVKYDPSLTLDSIGSGTQTSLDGTDNFNISQTETLFVPDGMFLVKDFNNGYRLYSNQDATGSVIWFETVINPIYVLRLPTGLSADVNQNIYDNYLIYKAGTGTYSPASNKINIDWAAAQTPAPLTQKPTKPGVTTDYTEISYSSDYDGCSGTITLNSATSPSETINKENGLELVGNTVNGENLYETKSKDFKIYSSLWFNKVQQNGLTSLTYNDFLALKPVLILKNSLGIYSAQFRNDLVSSVCWGEPLIYLYPQKATNISVGLSKAINLSESQPDYKTGWKVTAYPSGEIFNIENQRFYPYLYWEGSAPPPSTPVLQAVVESSQIHAYLTSALTKLGLNAKETADFENYWESKMSQSSYYIISFYDANEIQPLVPLNINPKPDTLIRILMSYSGENTKPKVNTINLDNYLTPVRNGFTVVEWGGILHK